MLGLVTIGLLTLSLGTIGLITLSMDPRSRLQLR